MYLFWLTATVAPVNTFPYSKGYMLSHPINESLGCLTYVTSIALVCKLIHNITQVNGRCDILSDLMQHTMRVENDPVL